MLRDEVSEDETLSDWNISQELGVRYVEIKMRVGIVVRCEIGWFRYL